MEKLKKTIGEVSERFSNRELSFIYDAMTQMLFEETGPDENSLLLIIESVELVINFYDEDIGITIANKIKKMKPEEMYTLVEGIKRYF